MTEVHLDTGKLLLTYDPFSHCDADPEAKERRILIDAVVACVHDGTNCPSYDIEGLVACESDICGGEIDWFWPVSKFMYEDNLSDLSLRECEGLRDGDKITDEMRLRHGLSVIEDLLNGELQGDQPATTAMEIVDTRGRSCLIAYELEGYSFSGVSCETIGAFRDEREIHRWYHENGYMISLDDMQDVEAMILAIWDYDVQPLIITEQPVSRGNVVDFNLWKLQHTQ